MTLAVSILAALLLISLVLLADQWLKHQVLNAFLALRKIPLPTEEELAKCYRLVWRRFFRRRK